MARPVGTIVPTERLIANLPFNLDDAIRRYKAGEGLEPLAYSLGTSHGRLRHIFERLRVELRGRSSAMKVRLDRLGTDGRLALTQAAHDSLRGKKIPKNIVRKMRIGRAVSLQTNQTFVGRDEQRLNEMLRNRGVQTETQKAVGPYNIDIARFPVAVEVHTPTNHPSKVSKLRRRTEYLLERGWWLIYVRPTKARPLSEIAADEVVAFLEKAERHPSPRGEYRVIWGSGQDSPREGLYGRH